MSQESYAKPLVCTWAPNCRFVNLTLWIHLRCAEMAHKARRSASNRPMGWPVGQEISRFLARYRALNQAPRSLRARSRRSSLAILCFSVLRGIPR
jgi:hypothetical protein